MENRVLVSTRKGLFEFHRTNRTLVQTAHHFFGDNCCNSFSDPRDGCVYAMLDHGHFGVKVHRSDDAGLTWTEIHEAGPSTFGFAVAVHPNKPDTAWFVPAKNDELRIPVEGEFVVTRTDDSGESFSVCDEGLPRPAWDLVLRHCLDVDDDGECLVMGSSTGGLYDSTDGGNSWSCVSAHLP